MARRTRQKQAPNQPKKLIAFRADADAFQDLDAYVKVLNKDSPGVCWTRSSAAHNLVVQGLRHALASKDPENQKRRP